MISQKLLDYISSQTNAGVATADIRENLLNQGWNEIQVDAALRSRNSVNNAPDMSRSAAAAEVARMGRFRASWLLFQQTWRLLLQDREVVLFPLFSAVCSLLVFGLFALAIFGLGLDETLEQETTSVNPVLYTLLFWYYLITFFVVTFFKVGLTAVVYERMNGGDLSFRDGLGRAWSIADKLLLWSLIAATVGVVLRFISDRSKWLGKLAVGLLGAGWNLVTFFIAPTLLLDNVSVWQSIKNSGTTFKKTWGETLITTVSLSLVTTIINIGCMFVFVLGAIALSASGAGLGVVIALMSVCLVVVFTISIVSASLSEIFKVALYSYARFGVIAEGFSPELIAGSLKENKKRP